MGTKTGTLNIFNIVALSTETLFQHFTAIQIQMAGWRTYNECTKAIRGDPEKRKIELLKKKHKRNKELCNLLSYIVHVNL